MTKFQKGILWAAAGMTYVFALSCVLAWISTGYIDTGVVARMALMLAPVLVVAAVLFARTGWEQGREEPAPDEREPAESEAVETGARPSSDVARRR